ncbi:MAG: hypothetical protein EBR82_18845 [Caulobacteraceae bacterium]|nr:hypothetical protein [Caulobacteraceae bacterium]
MHVDLRNQLVGAPSQLPGSTALSGTTAANGSAVDCDLADGPIYGIFNTGAATGSPTSFTVTCKLQESDTSGGTYTDLVSQTTLVLSAGSTMGIIQGIRTKRYVRTVVTPAFTGGSSPTVPTSANVVGQKRRIGT